MISDLNESLVLPSNPISLVHPPPRLLDNCFLLPQTSEASSILLPPSVRELKPSEENFTHLRTGLFLVALAVLPLSSVSFFLSLPGHSSSCCMFSHLKTCPSLSSRCLVSFPPFLSECL